ncbi:MiaB protein [Salmonella enterica subsp. enterica serovar Typhimurium]|nr:MiaB protein [Salmonella enterica subsp. enterica serovar Typhimurium]
MRSTCWARTLTPGAEKTTTAPRYLADLLRLVAAIDGIDRIRFTTSHPIEFTDDIIEVYRDTPELVSFLHLPVQSGSDRVLNLMGRTHTALNIKQSSVNCARRGRTFR